jgi:RHS repeat-associated protein
LRVPLTAVTFKYDPFGRRIEKISPNATSIFVYDGDSLVETANSSGGEVARYTQGQDIDEPLAMERGSTVDYCEADGLGSVTSLSASNGTVAQSYTYDSFGNTTNSSGSLTNFFRYTAREFDTETNLYYYRARYYDATGGRFLSEDPARFGIESSPQLRNVLTDFYPYVGNNPLNRIDPSGLWEIEFGGGWGPGVLISGNGISDFTEGRERGRSSVTTPRTRAVTRGSLRGELWARAKLVWAKVSPLAARSGSMVRVRQV